MAAIVMYVFKQDKEITNAIPRGSLMAPLPNLLVKPPGTPVAKTERPNHDTEYYWDNLSEMGDKIPFKENDFPIFIAHVYDEFQSSRNNGIVLWKGQYYSIKLSLFHTISTL